MHPAISRPPLTIREVRTRALRVPMQTPHRTASGVVSESPLIALQVITDQGIIGTGLIFTYTAAALRPTAELIDNIGELLANETVAPQAIYDTLHARFRLLGTQGLVGMAIAGIDMALWDVLCKAHKVPLARLLGGTETPVQAYGAIGYDGLTESARTAEYWAHSGFRGVKAKIGYPTVAEDVEVIRAIRSAVGPDVAIMVDYNQSLTPGEAVERCRRLDAEGLAWIEEPVASHDFQGHAQVANATATSIQSGENWWGPLDLRHAIEAKATDLCMLDVMKIGGVTGWTRGAALAAAHGLRVSNHLWPEISAQLLSVTPTAHWLEYADWWAPVMREPLRVESGFAQPGSVDVEERALAHFEV